MTLDDLLPISVLNPIQISNARVIIREFLLAGMPVAVALAAVANSWGESQLGLFNYGDNGQSIGLFQLSATGAGRGMSVEERLDPATNTRRIIQEVRDYGSNLMAAVERGDSVSELIALFTRDIERPRDVPQAQTQRINWAKKAMPQFVNMSASYFPSPYLLLPFAMPWYYYAIPSFAIGLSVIGAIIWVSRGQGDEAEYEEAE